MKKVFTYLMLMNMINLKAISQNHAKVSSKLERNISVLSFEQLIIDGNFKLTLVENEEPGIQVKGSPRFVKAFKIRQSKDVLLIRSICTEDRKNNQVIVNVKNLKKLTIQEASVINTRGILQSEDLNIQINAECTVNISNHGNTKVSTSEDFNLEIVK